MNPSAAAACCWKGPAFITNPTIPAARVGPGSRPMNSRYSYGGIFAVAARESRVVVLVTREITSVLLMIFMSFSYPSGHTAPNCRPDSASRMIQVVS